MGVRLSCHCHYRKIGIRLVNIYHDKLDETHGEGTTGRGACLPDPAGLSSCVAPAYNLLRLRGPQTQK